MKKDYSIEIKEERNPQTQDIPFEQLTKLHFRCFNKKGVPLIVYGNNWLICLSITIGIIIVCLLYSYFLKQMVSRIEYFLILFCFMTVLLSYSYTWITNPGIVMPDYSDSPLRVFCPLCNFWYIDSKGLRVKHCVNCNICIEGKMKAYNDYI